MKLNLKNKKLRSFKDMPLEEWGIEEYYSIFSRVLQYHGISFITYLNEVRLQGRTFSLSNLKSDAFSIIDHSFTWSLTNQGSGFWSKVDDFFGELYRGIQLKDHHYVMNSSGISSTDLEKLFIYEEKLPDFKKIMYRIP
jgi:hypothetical protein